MRTPHPALLGALAAVLLALVSGCGLRGELAPILTPTPSAANLLQNGGFESGDSPWQLPLPAGSAAKVRDARAHSGTNSLGLALASTSSTEAGASQPLTAATIPEFVSGFYRADEWKPGDIIVVANGAVGATQYIEFTVTVRGGGFADGALEHTLHFSIAGAQRQPASSPENSFVFLSRAAPNAGAWTYFAYPVAQAFEARFGTTQATVDGVTLGVDVAADRPTPNTGALVYIDDLYAGPQPANPNRPADD